MEVCLTRVSFTFMLHVNYNQCSLLLIIFGEVHFTIIAFPKNVLFVLGTHNLSILVHHSIHLVCTFFLLVSNDVTCNFVCILICSSLQLLATCTFSICGLKNHLLPARAGFFPLVQGVVSTVYW